MARAGRTRGGLPRSRRRTAPGAPPGTLVGDKGALPTAVEVIAFGPDRFSAEALTEPDDIPAFLSRWPVVWVNVAGLADHDLVVRLGHTFGLHDLALEDVLNPHQRPKIDDYGRYTYIATQALRPGRRVETEQVSIFLGENFVVTFLERPAECIEAVRDRLERGHGRLRAEGPDYLAYALIDAVIDGYFPALERYGEVVEVLEDLALEEPSRDLVTRIHDARRDLMMFRRAIWPQRELVGALIRGSSPLIKETTQPYLRDCYDHTIQLLDMTEAYREVAASLFELYLSSVNTKMNEIMKVLTIIATIFIPLSFITGVYGMNFNPARSPWNMPELNWYWGYPMALGVMAVVGLGLLAMFWHRGWIGGRPPRRPRRGSRSAKRKRSAKREQTAKRT